MTVRSPTLPGSVGGDGEPVVLVIDDDVAMRESLTQPFQVGWLAGQGIRFGPRISAEQASERPQLPGARYQVAGDEWS